MSINKNHCTDIASLSSADIEKILERAQELCHIYEKDGAYPQSLAGKLIYTVFFEDSTRTRVSFETAALRAGAHMLSIPMKNSSVNKGESFSDTLMTLDSYAPDAVIMRSSDYNAPQFAAQIMSCSIINAGDSWRAHPTQALLDALTIRQHKGSINGLKIAICGDISHSRVARSNYELLSKLGANLRIVAPDFFMPKPKEFEAAERYTDFEKGIKDCDIVMMLRIQKERIKESGIIMSDRDYAVSHGLTGERIDRLCHSALIMHPAPMNRGVEIDDEAADDPHRSLIFKQMANGVPTRIAVMEYCLLD
jgi:aspartate carbamoyltransferase catalytic subunit